MNILKKGAMFGLDARIALAIFGALSVISGAALYSAIQNSKVTSFVANLNEIIKAIESYYLDTGVLPKVSSTSSTILDITQLVDNSENLTGWKGPYLPYDTGYSNAEPNLKINVGCKMPPEDDLNEGETTIRIRRFNNPNDSNLKDYRIHMQCLLPSFAKGIAKSYNGDDTLSSDTNLMARFIEHGDDHYQLYLKFMTR
jgi:type II secretory pathway pseudopilin PulG